MLENREQPSLPEKLPKISVLVAARNEEKHISSCINALLDLKYPSRLVEILVGDDGSSDNTYALINEYESKGNIRVFKITERFSTQKGKADVLARLAHHATGEYFFFTDADVVVPESWIEGMLGGFKEGVGMVSGVTGIREEGMWAYFQRLDWIFALGLVKVINNLGYSATALGNNMAVSREAYYAVGGYENIPFSVTEDFELLKQIKRKGYKGGQLYNKEVLAQSAPEPGWKRLLHQRKRWMKGAVQLPFVIVAVLAIQAVFFPVLCVFLFLDPFSGIALLLIKITGQSLFVVFALRKVKEKPKLIALFLYEFYSATLSLFLLGFYFLPIRISWKGRRY